ncbi:hypothetical protein [Algivirga pacifica]|uniref:DUF4350 domain-containing protein n=1 Tax=Algivirga pacifica TaxID=1162670 RepID=A0ABP9D8Q5_9BACT
MKKMLTKRLLFCFVLYLAATYLNAQEISLYNIKQESSEVSSTLKLLEKKGYHINNFSGETYTEVRRAIEGKDILVLPFSEGEQPVFTQKSLAAVRDFVNEGKTLVVIGAQQQLLNYTFDLSLNLQELGGICSFKHPDFIREGGSHLSYAPDAVIHNKGTYAIETLTLPANSTHVYGKYGNTTVAVIPYGKGKIIFMGWSFEGALPYGNINKGWLDALDASVKDCSEQLFK